MRCINDNISNQDNGQILWSCRCDCGSIVEMTTEALQTSSKSLSCGCMSETEIQNGISFNEKCGNSNNINKTEESANECSGKVCNEKTQKDISGKRYGLLVVKEPVNSDNNSTYWLCSCDCGNEIITSLNALESGSVENCGCLSSSNCEQYISSFIKKHEGFCMQRITFDGLLGVHNGYLSYDFGIFDVSGNCILLIEYQGGQHYFSIEYFGGDEQFAIQQEHDRRKREFAKSHNIPLIEIPYIYHTKKDVCNYLIKELVKNKFLPKPKNYCSKHILIDPRKNTN